MSCSGDCQTDNIFNLKLKVHDMLVVYDNWRHLYRLVIHQSGSFISSRDRKLYPPSVIIDQAVNPAVNWMSKRLSTAPRSRLHTNVSRLTFDIPSQIPFMGPHCTQFPPFELANQKASYEFWRKTEKQTKAIQTNDGSVSGLGNVTTAVFGKNVQFRFVNWAISCLPDRISGRY